MHSQTVDGRLGDIRRKRWRSLLSWRPISFHYVGGIGLDVAKYTLAVLIGVETIFLSDLVISTLLPLVLEHQSGVISLLQLIILAIPDGLYIALPLAILVSAYLVILRRKEAREFTIIAGMGYGVRALIVLSFVLGLAGFAVSSLLAGYLEPHARYLMKNAFSTIAHKALRDGELAPGKFYEMGAIAVFASGGRVNELAHDVFIHQSLAQDRTRVIIASNTFGLNAIEGEKLGLILENVAVYEFTLNRDPSANSADGAGEPACTECAQTQTISPVSQQTVNKLFLEVPRQEFPELIPRGQWSGELTNLELLTSDVRNKGAVLVLSERSLRGILCILAPFFAVLAAALTTKKTFLFSLPIAAGIILAGSFFGNHVVAFLAPIGLWGTLGILFGICGALVVLTSYLLTRFQHGFIQPAGVNI